MSSKTIVTENFAPTLSANSANPPATKSISRYFINAARVILGLGFAVFGLNGFMNFIPPPTTPFPEGATAFVGALMNSGYMLPLIAGTQLLTGVLLLANRFVPLALALLAPFIVNAVAFHVFLERSGLPTVLIVLALELYLAWAYRNAFRPMLASRVSPA